MNDRREEDLRCYTTTPRNGDGSETFRRIDESGEHSDSENSEICEFVDEDVESPPSNDSMHSFYLEKSFADEEFCNGERAREKDYEFGKATDRERRKKTVDEENENGLYFESTKSRRKRKLSSGGAKVDRIWKAVSKDRAKKYSLRRGCSSSPLRLDGSGSKTRELYEIGNGNGIFKRNSVPKEIRYKWKEFESKNENEKSSEFRRKDFIWTENKARKGIGTKIERRIESSKEKEIEENEVREWKKFGKTDECREKETVMGKIRGRSGTTSAQSNDEQNDYRRELQDQTSRCNPTMEKDRNAEANLLEEIKKRIDKDFEQIEIRERSRRRLRRRKNRSLSSKQKPSGSAGQMKCSGMQTDTKPDEAPDDHAKTVTTEKYDSHSMRNERKAKDRFDLVKHLCGDSSIRAGNGKKLTKSQIDEAVKKMIDELIHMERRSIAIPHQTRIEPVMTRELHQFEEVRREDSPTRSCRTSASSRDFSQESDLSSGEEAYLANISPPPSLYPFSDSEVDSTN